MNYIQIRGDIEKNRLLKIAKQIISENEKETKKLDKIIYDWEHRKISIIDNIKLFLNITKVNKSELAKKEQEYFSAYTIRTFHSGISEYKHLVEDIEKSGDLEIFLPCCLYNSLIKKEWMINE